MEETTVSAGNSTWLSFLSTTSLIATYELGDKTFLIASLMALQKSRWTVLLGSISAMLCMNAISLFLGSLFVLIPHWLISRFSTTLFLMFGSKMLWDSTQTSPEEEALDDYLRTQKIVARKKNMKREIALNKRIIIYTQVFWLLFFAEMGDKSQISIMLLASKQGLWPVGLGAALGAFLSSVIAIVGSRSIERFIPVKKFSTIAGVLFIVYAFLKF